MVIHCMLLDPCKVPLPLVDEFCMYMSLGTVQTALQAVLVLSFNIVECRRTNCIYSSCVSQHPEPVHLS